MRFSSVAREATRNVSTGTSRVVLLFAIAMAAVGSCVSVEVLAISQRVLEASEYRAAGAAVTVMSLPGRVQGEACEALARVPDVLAAGALRETGEVRAITLPGEPLDLYEVTPQFGRVLGAPNGGAGVYVSRDVAASLGAETLPITVPPVHIRGTFDYPPDGRRAGFGWAVLAPTKDVARPFDECWVLAWPQRDDMRQIMFTAAMPSASADSGEPPSIAQLNTKFGASFTGAEDYRSRITQFAGQAAVALGGFMGAASLWMRRVELASNIHAGARRRDLRLQYLLETGAWTVPVAVSCTGLGCLLALALVPSEAASLCLRSLQISGWFLLSALVGAVAGVHLIRERDLSRFVKGR